MVNTMRFTKDSCNTCQFWLEIKTQRADQRLGHCARRAPVPILVGHAQHPIKPGETFPIVNGFFPQTRPEIWCGEFEARPVAQGQPIALDLSRLSIDGEAQ